MGLADFEVPHQRDFAWTVGTDANLSHDRGRRFWGSTGTLLV